MAFNFLNSWVENALLSNGKSASAWQTGLFCFALLASVLFGSQFNQLDGQVVSIGKAKYRSDLPNDQEDQPRRSIKAKPSVSEQFLKSNATIPTNDWCSSLVWPLHSPHSLPMFAHPLAMQAHPSGLGIGYNPVPKVTDSRKDGKVFQAGTDYRYPYRESLIVGLEGMSSADCVLDRHSDWTVTALWKPSETAVAKNGELRATFGHGLPFVYFKRTGNTPVRIQFTGGKVDRSETPIDPIVFEMQGITAKYLDGDEDIQLMVDAFEHIGLGSKARLSYDFDGDGVFDRVVTLKSFATDPVQDSWEAYTREISKVDPVLSFGGWNDFENGTVKLEFWKCFGEGELRLNLAECKVQLPFAKRSYYPNQDGGFSPKPTNGIPTLSSDNDAKKAKVFYRDQHVLGVTVNQTHYGLFAPTGTKWSEGEGLDEAIIDLAGRDYLSVAVLPNELPETIQRFQRYAYAFITDSHIEYQYDSDSARVLTRFSVTTEAEQGANQESLLALYRHQHLHLVEQNRLTPDRYESPRGEMKVVAGDSFSTSTPFLGVLPSLPCAKPARQQLGESLDAYVEEISSRQQTFERKDTYWNGKEFGKIAEAIQIANQLGRGEQRDHLVQLLKARMEDWFDGKSELFFYYDQTWSTLVGYPDSYGSAEQLNDHHFHYSYFIKAAATIATYDPEWVAQESYGGMIDLLIRNCACPDRDDKLFPWMRFFDPYAGHSWASGHAGFASGNNQESSSESMNFATALILYGDATDNIKIRDLGVYWHATEAEAIRQYWFDNSREVFPDRFGHSCVGMVWSDGGTYGTWWTANPEEIHGINFLPLNGGSLYLGRDADYVLRNHQDLVKSNQSYHTGFEGDPKRFDRWQDILYEHLAMADPVEAEKRFRSNGSDEKSEFGETKLHTQQWITAFNSLGQFDDSVFADHFAAVVFKKGPVRNYVVSNTDRENRRVKFSDGAAFDVPFGLHVFSK